MKFLVDENLSKSDKFLKDHLEFVNLKHLMKPGEADDEIIEKALVHDFMTVTKDIKLALNSLIRGVRVWYYDAEKILKDKILPVLLLSPSSIQLVTTLKDSCNHSQFGIDRTLTTFSLGVFLVIH